MTAEQSLTGAFRRVPQNGRRAFLFGLGFGLMTHMYALTNLLPNRDSNMQVFGHGALSSSGRWFLKVFAALNSCFTLPWLNGLISLLALALCCAVVVLLLRINGLLPVGLVSASIVTFPSVSNTFGYMFTADAYFLALALFALCVYLTDRIKWGCFAAAPLMALATACYQPYLCFAAALFALRGLQILSQGQSSDREALEKLLRFLLTTAAALAIYLLLTKLVNHVTGTAQAEYMGANEMGRVDLASIPKRILEAYRAYFAFLWGQTRDYAGSVAALANMGLLLVTAGLFLMDLLRRKRTPLQTLLFPLFFLLLPLFLNCVYLLGTTSVHVLMLLPLSLTPAAAAVLYQGAQQGRPGRTYAFSSALLGWGMVVFTLCACLYWGVYANKGYLELHLKYENDYAMTERVLDRVEQTEGYSPDVAVAILGTCAEGSYPPTKAEAFARVGSSVGFGDEQDYGFIDSDAHFHAFVRYYLGVNLASLTEEQLAWASINPAVQTMPCYPAQGSVALVDGVVIVKLSD